MSAIELSPSDIRRFIAKVNFGGANGCWEWTAALDRGYGAMHVGGKKGRKVYGHAVMMQLVHGPCPDGLEHDHLCRNRKCCNPLHLERVTRLENQRRQHGLTHCKWGHPRTPENTWLYRSWHGTGQLIRYCRPCRLARTQAWRDAQAAKVTA